jgi:hypothetical protein
MERPHPQYASGSSPQANSFTSLLGSREPDTPRASSSAESSSHLPPQGFPISLSSLPFRGPAASQSNRSSFLVGLDSLVFQSILTSVFSNQSDDSPYSSAKAASLNQSITEKVDILHF